MLNGCREAAEIQFYLETVRILLVLKNFVKTEADLTIQSVFQPLNLRCVVVRVLRVDH